MAGEVFKRCEKKFLLTAHQYYQLLAELDGKMQLDAYNKKSPFYTISNLYFDTDDHYFIRQSVAKPTYKEKLRLRSYGAPALEDVVFLELKKKLGGTVHKRRSKLVLEDAYRFTQGQSLLHPEIANHQVLKEIAYLLYRHPDLKPRLYLSYDRKAMFSVEDPGLRITFDRNIQTRRHDLRLESGADGCQLLREELWLMEVKAEGGAPLWLTRLLADLQAYPTSFSKYGAEYQRTVLERLQEGGKTPCLRPLLKASLAATPSTSARQWLAS